MRPLTILSVCVFLFSCSIPNKLLDAGKVEKAFHLTSKKLKFGKNVSVNSLDLIKAAHQLRQNELNYNFPFTQSAHVNDWVQAQNNYFKTLEDIVAANNLVEVYNLLCTHKIELDLKIADQFYLNGDDLLATHYDQLSKHHAREAYFQYQECQSLAATNSSKTLKANG